MVGNGIYAVGGPHIRYSVMKHSFDDGPNDVVA